MAQLKIEAHARDERQFEPEKIPENWRVLDVGCGAGRTLLTSCRAYSYGVDIDCDVLLRGKALSNNIGFICGRAEALPFADCAFDLVLSRVALPYTNIPKSLAEIHRVLKPDGQLWAVLERPTLPFHLGLHKKYKFYALAPYLVLNTLAFHLFGKSVPFVDGKYRGYQTVAGAKLALSRAGFVDIVITEALHLVVKARRTRPQESR